MNHADNITEKRLETIVDQYPTLRTVTNGLKGWADVQSQLDGETIMIRLTGSTRDTVGTTIKQLDQLIDKQRERALTTYRDQYLRSGDEIERHTERLAVVLVRGDQGDPRRFANIIEQRARDIAMHTKRMERAEMIVDWYEARG